MTTLTCPLPCLCTHTCHVTVLQLYCLLILFLFLFFLLSTNFLFCGPVQCDNNHHNCNTIWCNNSNHDTAHSMVTVIITPCSPMTAPAMPCAVWLHTCMWS